MDVFLNTKYLQSQVVIIEASPLSSNLNKSPHSAQIIDFKDENNTNKSQTLSDLLKKIPGVEVIRQGGLGQTTSVFIRGARSESTLVLIDGVEVQDSLSPSGGFDFSTLLATNIERIEVFLGPQSVRFGAGALGGVISIRTKEGQGKSNLGYWTEVGSYGTYGLALSSSEKFEKFHYSSALHYASSKGFSAASESLGNSEKDGVQIGLLSLKGGWIPSSQSKVESTVRMSDGKVDLDLRGGRGGDDPNNESQLKQVIVGLSGSHEFIRGTLQSQLGVYFSQTARQSFNHPDPLYSLHSSDDFLSETLKIQSESNFFLSEFHSLFFDFSYRREGGRAASLYDGFLTRIPWRMQSVTGLAFSHFYESPTWFFDWGARMDFLDRGEKVESFRFSFGRDFQTGTRLETSYGTGFKRPSLYQLYSVYGNENLDQETSYSFDLTLSQKLAESVHFTFRAFENHWNNLLDFNLLTNHYFNLSKAKSHGFEVQGQLQGLTFWEFTVGLGLLNTRDENSGLELLRRPRETGFFSVKYRLSDKTEVYTQYRYQGSREDVDPQDFHRLRLPFYQLITLGGSYTFTEKIKIHSRIENFLNEKYEEVAGYQTMGQAIFIGLSGEL